MFSGFQNGTFRLVQMVTAPLAFLLYLIVARVTVELILAMFRIADTSRRWRTNRVPGQGRRPPHPSPIPCPDRRTGRLR
jgi:hypothetical protein